MEQRVYHGARLSSEGLAQALLEEWDRGDTVAQSFGDDNAVIVQIGQRQAGWFSDEPRLALTIEIDRLDDGLRVTMGQQQWYKERNVEIFAGGLIGFFPFFFTFPLGGLLGTEEIAHGFRGRVWETIERYTSTYGAATGQTVRLTTQTCPSCGVTNPQGAEFCTACGASLGGAAPATECPQCSFNNPPGARFCNQCGTRLRMAA